MFHHQYVRELYMRPLPRLLGLHPPLSPPSAAVRTAAAVGGVRCACIYSSLCFQFFCEKSILEDRVLGFSIGKTAASLRKGAAPPRSPHQGHPAHRLLPTWASQRHRGRERLYPFWFSITSKFTKMDGSLRRLLKAW